MSKSKGSRRISDSDIKDGKKLNEIYESLSSVGKIMVSTYLSALRDKEDADEKAGYGGENMRIDRIKVATELTRQDMTQNRLAELSGVSRAAIGYIKNGKSCSPKVAKKLADALKVDLKKLLE